MTSAATGEEPAENATIVGEEMSGWLKGVEGFEGMLMLYAPGTTLGLTFWEKRELAERASDGLGMLVEQAAESFFVWRGVRPATRQVLEKLRGA